MSDASASLIGSGVSQQLQKAGQLPASAGQTKEGGTTTGFSNVFQEVIEQDGLPQDSDASAAAALPADTAALPLQALALNAVIPVTAEMTTTDTLDPAAFILPPGMTGGNELPEATPAMLWSGYVAYRDDKGAAAQAFASDGELLLQMPVKTDPQLATSLQRSQQQLRDYLTLAPTSITLNNQPVLAAQTGDFMTQLTNLGKDRQLADISALTATPQNTTGSFAAHFAPTALTELGHQLSSSVRSGDAIPVMPQHPNWGQELGDRVQWMIGRQMQSAEIRLNPPELGSLEVRIQLHGDQATVNFSSPHGVVRDAIDAALPRLREMLAESGLQLADANVSSQSHGHADQRAGQSGAGGQANDGGLDSVGMDGTDMRVIAQPIGNSMLDVYA